MAKKSSKLALTYFITIIFTLLIIGGVCVLMMKYLLYPDSGASGNADNPVIMEDEYVPPAEHDKTTLIIFDSAKRMSGCCFMLVRTYAAERSLVLIPIPADTYARVEGSENSIYEFYRTGGTKKAVSAAENALKLNIDYYLKLNDDSFGTLVSVFGGVDFNVPYTLIYTDPDTGEETIYHDGEIYMDENDFRKIITYPLYNSGEEYRAKMLGVAASDLVNRNVSEGFSNHIDDYFSLVINSTVETNFTAYDYAEQSETLKYIADSGYNIARLITVTGAYNDESLFVLEDGFLNAVPDWLGINGSEENTQHQ